MNDFGGDRDGGVAPRLTSTCSHVTFTVSRADLPMPVSSHRDSTLLASLQSYLHKPSNRCDNLPNKTRVKMGPGNSGIP